MSFSTYADLQTAIINELHRNDLATVVIDWIALCEADFNRRLRLSTMETVTTFTLDAEEEDLPTGFKELKNIQLLTTPTRILTYMSPQEMVTRYGAVSGLPAHYCVIGNQFRFAPPPDASYTCEVAYFAAIDALSDSATSNWMLANNPDVYFYGSLIHSAPYILNDKRISTWEMLYEKALLRVEQEDTRKKQSGSAMEMRSDVVSGEVRYY